MKPSTVACRAKGHCVLVLSVLVASIPQLASATDIVNGWSIVTTISKIHSEGASTLFRLSGTTDSCGHPDFWTLALDDTARSRAKHALLIAAFTAQKTVSLRCENSLVTDFEVLE